MNDSAVLSIDLELFNHTPAYRSADGIIDEPIGLDGWQFIRTTLEKYDADATIFIVSELAEEFPDTVANIAASGFEIGSHTHTHRPLNTLDRTERVDEVEKSRSILAEVSSTDVVGFRAPAFDIPADHFNLLHDAGYEYDSSVVPSRRIPGWYGGEYKRMRICSAADLQPDAPESIAEIPVSVMPWARLPLTGAWIRLLGRRYTLLGMELLRRRGIPPVLYLHPWEFVELPSIDGIPKRVYRRTGDWMRATIHQILDGKFDFISAKELLRQEGLK